MMSSLAGILRPVLGCDVSTYRIIARLKCCNVIKDGSQQYISADFPFGHLAISWQHTVFCRLCYPNYSPFLLKTPFFQFCYILPLHFLIRTWAICKCRKAFSEPIMWYLYFECKRIEQKDYWKNLICRQLSWEWVPRRFGMVLYTACAILLH